MSNNKKGFTLVEIVIVLVILSILAAVTAPPLFSYISDSHKSECDANLSAINSNFKIYADSSLGLDVTDNETNNQTNVANAFKNDYPDKNNYSCPDGGVYSWRDGRIVCSKHGTGLLPIDSDVINQLGTLIPQFISEFKFSATCDLTAADIGEETTAYRFIQALKEKGIDLSQYDVQYFYYQWEESTNKRFFYWSTIDIRDYGDGSKVPLMRYNYSTGTNTVWIGTVSTSKYNSDNLATKDKPFKVLHTFTGYTPSTGQTAAQQTYDNMVELYKQALDEKLEKK